MASRSAPLRRKVATDRRLRVYRAKRDFARSPEPAGGRAHAKPGWSFVVQKHAATRLHYDFRLELEGVLLSWAVPKGPSLAPETRRLAMRTEDHPLEYAEFEGVIPEDEYGGGTVVVWDRGTWEPEGDPQSGLRRGRLTFELHGKKLRGRWHLVRTRGDGKGEPWLLFKGRDAAAREGKEIVDLRPESVLSGRSIEQVGAARDRVWHSNREARASREPQARASGASAARTGGTSRRRSARTGDASSRGRVTSKPKPNDTSSAELIELVKSLPVDFSLTNLDKVLYPEQGLTKASLIAYLAVVEEPLLAQIGGRPLTLVRCPEGRHRSCFFQKHVKDGTPPSIGTVEIREDAGVALYMRVDDLAGVVGLAQLGTLEIHTWGSHADKLERPDQLVFDLDPDPALGWEPVVDAALTLRIWLRELGLETFLKTTGGKGLHLVAPVERRIGWDDFKAFAKAAAEHFAAEHPDRYTTNPLKAQRRGRLFVDYLRNGRGATAVAAYSPRARENAPVATPVTWHELEGAMRPSDFTIESVPARLASIGDPWSGYADLRQSITAAARRRVGA